MNIREQITEEIPYLKEDVRLLNNLYTFLDELNKLCYQINELQSDKTVRVEVIIEDKNKH